MIYQILEGTLKLVAKPKQKEVILNALTAQCPSTWARREDVLTKHIVYKHTKSEKL